MVERLGNARIDFLGRWSCARLRRGHYFEGWKHDIRNVWWIIDYNRQSLDSVVKDRLFHPIDGTFRAMGWDVVTLKYGKRLQKAFAQTGGEALRDWIDNCPNSLYSSLVYRGGALWRASLKRDLGSTQGISALLDEHDDPSLQALMTNLAGHDMESILEAFHGVKTDAPTCFIAYTIKGYGLPFAGHKDNHSGLMTPDQMEVFRRALGVAPGQEYEPFAGLDVDQEQLRRFLAQAPFAQHSGRAGTIPSRSTFPRRWRSRREQKCRRRWGLAGCSAIWRRSGVAWPTGS